MATNDLITRANAVLAQTKAEGTKKFAGSKFDTTKPITTDQLQPVQPFNLNLPTPKVPSSGLESAITGSVNTYKTQGEQERAMREASQKTAGSDLKTTVNEIMGLNEDIGNVDNTVDRTMEDTARKEADRYTSEIEAEQLASRRKIEALQKNPQGMTAGAIADESNRLERDSLSKQADLAILQNSALRNYSTAKDIADREVQNKLEPLKIKLENLKFFYQENKELFNKEDERLYNEKIKSEERAYEKEEMNLKEVSDLSITALQNGAPSSIAVQMRAAKTPEEAIKIGGSYIMSYQDKKARAEYNELINPTPIPGVPIPKSLEELKSSDREPLLGARATLGEVSEIQEILNRNSGNLADLETGLTEDSRRFKQLRANVVDKLARERTGAVIGADEKRDFKKILGVGIRQLGIKDIEEINKGLETFKNRHSETIRLIDPDGSIGAYLDQTAPLNIANNIINQYAGSSSGSSSLNNY